MTILENDSGVSSPSDSMSHSNHPHDLQEFGFEPLKIEASHLTSFTGFADSPRQSTKELFPLAGSKHAFNAHVSTVFAEIPVDTKERVLQGNFQCQKPLKIEASHLPKFDGFADSPSQNTERLYPLAGIKLALNDHVSSVHAQSPVNAKKERIRQIEKECQALIAEQNQIREHVAEHNRCYEQLAEHRLMQDQPLTLPMQPMPADTWWPYQAGGASPNPRIWSAPWGGHGMGSPWHHHSPSFAEAPFGEMLTEATPVNSCKPDFGDVATQPVGGSADEGCAGSGNISGTILNCTSFGI